MARGWKSLLLSVGESLREVFSAEAEALKADLAESGRRFSVALGLALLALFMLFWTIGAAAFAIFCALALWLPAWVSALIVLGIFLLLALMVALVARRRFLAIELPADTVRRRVEDHVAWWKQNLLTEGEPDSDRVTTRREDDRA